MIHIPTREHPIKAIIGLGNPGPKFASTRHNIGFLIVDALADRFGGIWQKKENMEVASISLDGHTLILIKPQTFMNSSGVVLPWLNKQGIKSEHILVVHDELELPFGKLKLKMGGSARGHNGLRSIMEHGGTTCVKLAFGIGRPENRDMVGDYVLQIFSEPWVEVERAIGGAVDAVVEIIKNSRS